MLNVSELALVDVMNDPLAVVANNEVPGCDYAVLFVDGSVADYFSRFELLEVIGAGIISADGKEISINW